MPDSDTHLGRSFGYVETSGFAQTVPHNGDISGLQDENMFLSMPRMRHDPLGQQLESPYLLFYPITCTEHEPKGFHAAIDKFESEFALAAPD